jgi:hypothetical protein
MGLAMTWKEVEEADSRSRTRRIVRMARHCVFGNPAAWGFCSFKNGLQMYSYHVLCLGKESTDDNKACKPLSYTTLSRVQFSESCSMWKTASLDSNVRCPVTVIANMSRHLSRSCAHLIQ